MTYIPRLKTASNTELSASGFSVTNNLYVSGNLNISSSSSTFLSRAVNRFYAPVTASAGISSSYSSTTQESLTVNYDSTFNVLSASSLVTETYYGDLTTVSVSENTKIDNLLLTSSNISTTNNSATILYSYPTKNDTTYLVESQIIAKKDDFLSSSIYSIRGVYKNVTGTLYLTGTSTAYSSSDFQLSSTLTTSYIDISPLNLTSVLSPGHQSYAMSSLYDQSTQKYYIATGQQNANSNAGIVRIFSSSDSVIWSSALATYNGGINSNLGTQIKLLSSSYGLYCLVSAYSESSANDVGSVHYASSSNGSNWSSLVQIETGSTTSRFGNAIDAIYDSINNKFILLVGALYEATQTGYVYCITSSNGVNWTSKQRILEGNSTLDNVGDGVAIISCSSGYQAYAAGRQEDIPSSSIGNIYVVTSSDALTWSTKIVIVSGSYTNNATTNLGVGGIKAINYNNRSYVFFPETIYDTGSVSTSNEGAVFVISSSDNNSWGNVDIYSTKTLIASGSTPSDTIPENATVTKTLDVNIFGNKIYYAFGAPLADTANVDAGKVYLGSSSDGLTWQKYIAGQQDMTVFTGSVTSNFFGRSTSILSSANYLNLYTNNTSAIFYTNVAYVTQSGVPGVNLADVSFGISSSNITINVTGSTGINIDWNHLTKIYEV